MNHVRVWTDGSGRLAAITEDAHFLHELLQIAVEEYRRRRRQADSEARTGARQWHYDSRPERAERLLRLLETEDLAVTERWRDEQAGKE